MKLSKFENALMWVGIVGMYMALPIKLAMFGWITLSQGWILVCFAGALASASAWVALICRVWPRYVRRMAGANGTQKAD